MTIDNRDGEMGVDEEEDTVFDQANLLTNKIKSNNNVSHGSFKLRLMKTLALCAAFLGLGLCFAVLGPTLLDLKCHVGTDIPHISYVFTGRSLGYLLGSIIGGFLFDKFNQLLLLSFTLFLTSVATGLVPWSSQLMALAIAIGVQGLTMGFLDTGGNVLCLTLWGKKSGPFMQALHFSFGIGAFISPLLAHPFLGVQKLCQNNSLEFNSVGKVLNLRAVNFKYPEENDIKSKFLNSFPETVNSSYIQSIKTEVVFFHNNSNKTEVTSLDNQSNKTRMRNFSPLQPQKIEMITSDMHSKDDVNSSNTEVCTTRTSSAQSVTYTTTTIKPKKAKPGTNGKYLPPEDGRGTVWTQKGIFPNKLHKRISPPLVLTSIPMKSVALILSSYPSVSKHKVLVSQIETFHSTSGTTIATLTISSTPLTRSFKDNVEFGNIHTTTFSSTNSINITSSKLTFSDISPPLTNSNTFSIVNSSFSTVIPLTKLDPIKYTVVSSFSTLIPLKTSHPINSTVVSTFKNIKSYSIINGSSIDANEFLIISHIQFAYLIIAVFIFQTSIAFLVFFGIGSHNFRAIMPADINTQDDHNSRSSLRFQLLGLLFIFYFMYVGMEATYGGLIMTFSVYSKLSLSKSFGAYITSLFWGMFALARGFAIYFAKRFSPAAMLRSNLLLCIMASILLFFFAETYSWILWFGSGLLGVGMASIFPTGITWVEQYIDISNKEASILVVGSALGEMFLPALAGHFFKTINPMFLMNLILCLCILCLIIYLVLERIADGYGDKYDSLLLKKQTVGSSQMESLEDKMENEPLVESDIVPIFHESNKAKTVRFSPPSVKWTKLTKHE